MSAPTSRPWAGTVIPTPKDVQQLDAASVAGAEPSDASDDQSCASGGQFLASGDRFLASGGWGLRPQTPKIGRGPAIAEPALGSAEIMPAALVSSQPSAAQPMQRRRQYYPHPKIINPYAHTHTPDRPARGVWGLRPQPPEAKSRTIALPPFRHLLLLLAGLLLLLAASPLLAQDGGGSALSGLLALAGDGADGRAPLTLSLQLVLLLSLLALLPSVLLMMTAFVRILVVLAILRQALGLQQAPPNQLLVGLALFMTFFVMQPSFTAINEQALQPFVSDTIPAEQAIARSGDILHSFMLGNTRKADLEMFAGLAGDAPYASPADVPLRVLMPAFATSELKTAFQIGILLFLPFLVIDLVVATVLMALGMMMVSPMMIALPFKLMLFVAVDGWALVLSSLAQSFQGG